jgi:hypothetical protein
MCAPTDGWAMPSRIAAALKPPASTTHWKTLSRRELAAITGDPRL